MKRPFLDRFSYHIGHNFSYKLVSLFIALILWLTILGRRDFVLNKNIDVDFAAGPGMAVVTQSLDHVRVKVSGPRTALRKFMANGLSSSISIDVSDLTPGTHEVDIPLNKIEAPLGVRVLEVKPKKIRVEIIKVSLNSGDE